MQHVLDDEKLMGMNIAQNLLKEFQPRSRAGQDKATILYNLCLIYSKEPKQIESAVRVLSDMMEKKVNLGFGKAVINRKKKSLLDGLHTKTRGEKL